MTNSNTTKTIWWTIADILDATGGELLGEPGCCPSHAEFPKISIDSRQISHRDIFVAIKGDIHDGHAFIGDVVEHGVRGLVIDKENAKGLPLAEWKKKGILGVAVNDTTTALGDLAAFNRRRSKVSVVAITGSNGKTTTRKMTAAVAGQRFRTLSSPKSFNNEIGLPLTLLNLSEAHEWAVLELGMNHPGEIRKLAEICKPDVGIITNIGPAHLKGLGSLERVMRAKGELLEKLGPRGTAILNADDPRSAKLAVLHPQLSNLILFGSLDRAAIKALSITDKGHETSFTLELPTETIPIHLGVPGRFMVSNALAAAAAGYVLGLSAQEIRAGLEDFRPVQGRMNIFETSSGIHLVDDAYNANPGSMEAAILTLRSLKGDGRGILVIGDMLELGDHGETMHEKMGVMAAQSDIAKLYATGDFAETVAAGARNGGMDTQNIFTGSKMEIIEDLSAALRPGDWVLVKGSRAMGMEEIVKGLGD